MNPEQTEPELVDAHCHVDLFQKTAELLTAIDGNRVHTIAVTNAPFVFPHTQELAKRSPFLHPALGLHPELIATHASQLDQMLRMLGNTRFIGEVGLDYVTADRTLRHRQLSVFERILQECALHRDKVITIHSRRAARDVIAAVGPSFPGRVILHWFSGSLSELSKALAYGFLFSVNAAMARSENGRRILAELPADRVLTETDGPFLKIGGEPQTPPDVIQVLPALAEAWGMDALEARAIISRNFLHLLAPTPSPA